MVVTINQIKQLREATGISITECKRALKEANGDMEKAKEILRKIVCPDLAVKKYKREVRQGIIENYIHPGKKIGVLLDIRCESDFVARSEEFKKLAHELCLQIASMNPDKVSLLSQPWIRDENRTIKDLIDEYIARLGENIVVKRFVRYEI